MEKNLNLDYVVENLKSLKGLPLDLFACQKATFNQYHSNEYWVDNALKIIDDRGTIVRPAFNISAGFMHEIYSEFYVPTNLSESTYLKIETSLFENTHEEFENLDAQYTFNFFFNALKIVDVKMSLNSYQKNGKNIEWLQGILIEGEKTFIYIYADCEYGNKAILKICFDKDRIEFLIKKCNLREVQI
jgi:hypothetical protein